MNKILEYKKLVAERKACRKCIGLTNPSQIKGGCFDSEQIGPWTLWQGNLDAPIMVVGQDWGGTRYFSDNNGRDVRGNPTDLNLIKLVEMAGFSIQDVYLPQGQNVLFFTNAILCLKDGNLQADVEKDWFYNCFSFLRRQIEIVNPVVIVGMGKEAYQAILKGFGIKEKVDILKPEVALKEGRLLPNGSRVFAVYHCGKRVLNSKKTGRTMEEQKKDWMRIRKFLEKQRTNS